MRNGSLSPSLNGGRKLSPARQNSHSLSNRDDLLPLFLHRFILTFGGVKNRVAILCFLSLLFAVLNGIFMAKVARQTRQGHAQISFFGTPLPPLGPPSTYGVDKKLNGLTEDAEGTSRKLQGKALESSKKAIALRRENDDVCVTTLDREYLSEEERGLLLYSAPPPLTEFPNTLKSWNDALKGMGKLVIVTNDPGTRRLCRELDIPTLCVEHTDEGLPRLDKMFERMQKSQPNGIVAYVNSDLTIEDFKPMYDFLQRLQSNPLELRHARKIYEPFEGTGEMSEYWFAVATRVDILGNGKRERHTVGGYDFWAWNTKPNGASLLPFDMPPFRFPYSTYDNWLLDVMVQASERNVIDASVVVEILHQEHKRVGKNSNWSQALQSGVTGVYINRYLAYKEPISTLEAKGDKDSKYKDVQYMLQHGTPLGCPYVVEKDEDTGEFEIAKRRFFSNLAEDHPDQKKCIGRQKCPQRRYIRNRTTQESANMAMLPIADGIAATSTVMKNAEANWRYTMEEQLKQHSRDDGFVLLTAVNYAYRDHLMNFKCTIERVGMREHFVVAAMDEKMYKWGVLQGLPIFLAKSAIENSNALNADGGKFGSDGFQKVTKLKSRAVLDVLNAGYSVVWSDVDIMWFVHPFDALAGFMDAEGGIAIQSNAPHKQNRKKARPHKTVNFVKTDDPAGFRRLNSGLYVAPNNDLVRSAFTEIVRHAAQSSQTEQPSFDEILCARYPSERRYASCTYRKEIEDTWTRLLGTAMSKIFRRFWGEDRKNDKDDVEIPSSMHVELLDRFMFPSGAVLAGEDNKNAFVLGQKAFSKATGKPLYCAHNNWILGEDLKKKRAEDAGWWFTDHEQTCEYHGPGDLP